MVLPKMAGPTVALQNHHDIWTVNARDAHFDFILRANCKTLQAAWNHLYICKSWGLHLVTVYSEEAMVGTIEQNIHTENHWGWECIRESGERDEFYSFGSGIKWLMDLPDSRREKNRIHRGDE